MEIVFIILKGANLLLLMGVWLYSFKNYKNLPSRIPIHFNIEGEVDRFGSKRYFLLLPLVATLLLGLFFYLGNSPESANYPVKLTKDNYQFQYALGLIFTQVLLTVCLFLFYFIQTYTIGYLSNKKKSMVNFTLCIVGIFFTIIGYVILSNIYK